MQISTPEGRLWNRSPRPKARSTAHTDRQGFQVLLQRSWGLNIFAELSREPSGTCPCLQMTISSPGRKKESQQI